MLWLRYELFRGKLDQRDFEASEDNLMRFIGERLPSIAAESRSDLLSG